MLRKILFAAAAALSALALPVNASAQQQITFNVGYFQVRGESSRPAGDVLVEDLQFHAFNISDFNGATVSAEWQIPIGQFFEVGVGAGYYQRTVPTVYLDFVNANGSEIGQDFKLRIVPITGIVRFIPTGRRSAVQPYVGAGIGVFPWRYTESGEFFDSNGDIFRATFKGSGTETGPVVVGGIRFPIGVGFAFGGEIRYQRAEGKLNLSDFNGDRIDLGGISYLASLTVKF